MGKVVLEILGSGGASTIPKPLCLCHVCEEAREKGVPYARTAPGYFLHGPNILFDTPEEIKYQLERSAIREINACFYSHWHPDHTAGIRVWECNKSPRQLPVHLRTTPLYMADYVEETFKQRNGLDEKIAYMAKNKWVEKRIIPQGDHVTIDDTVITPFRLAEDIASGFDIRVNGKKILLIIDESFRWQPPQEYRDYDLLIIPTGVIKFHPITGERMVDEAHPILKGEPVFEDTLAIIKALAPKRTILVHFEEGDRLGHGDWQKIQAHYALKGIAFEPAVDQMRISL